ncbi:zinc ABC transporter substrate-binding protein, partial [Streptomyces violaceoruber]
GLGRPDPHFWTDPDRVRTAAGLIADRVSEHVTGVDHDAIRANAAEYDEQLADLTAFMEKSFDRVPEDRRNLVTNHHVFGYLADRFGFRVIGAVIPSGTTLASPSSSDLRSLTRAMERAGVRTVFADSSRPKRLAEVLSTELGDGVRVVELYSESLTAENEGAATYLQMMRANTTALTDGLTVGSPKGTHS